MEILATKAALFTGNSEQALECQQDGRFACTVNANEGGEAACQIDRCRNGPKTTKVRENELFNEHDSLFLEQLH
jgi:hypothetical protein